MQKLKIELQHKNTEMFFAEKVILVEGEEQIYNLNTATWKVLSIDNLENVSENKDNDTSSVLYRDSLIFGEHIFLGI